MATLQEMAEAHLLNVNREIQQLTERKETIDKEIARLSSYLQDGKQTLEAGSNKVESPIPQSKTFLGENYGK